MNFRMALESFEDCAINLGRRMQSSFTVDQVYLDRFQERRDELVRIVSELEDERQVLPRDDARIARLEDVADKAKRLPISFESHVSVARLFEALDALAALDDADAPGGG